MINDRLVSLVFRHFPAGEYSNLDSPDFAQEMRDGRANRLIPMDAAYILKGVYNDRGTLRHIGKPDQFIASSEGEIGWLGVFTRPAWDGDNEENSYIYLRKSGGNWHVRRDTATLSGASTLHTIGTAITNANEFEAIVAGKRLLFGYTNGTMQVWYGTPTGATSTDAGMPTLTATDEYMIPEYEPATADTMPAWAGDPKYQVVYVFEDGEGNLSNPSLITPYEFAADNANGQFFRWVGQHAYGGTYLTDNNIVRCHIFRIGGTNGLLRLSRTFVPAIGSGGGGYPVGILVDADTGLPPYDGTPDENLPNIFPSESRLPPPRGLNVLIWHQSRVFAAGYSTDDEIMEELGSGARLWFSRSNEPEAWGEDDNGAPDDGGFLDIDDDTSNRILALGSTGSVLIVYRMKSIHALYGSGFPFYEDERAPHGIAGRRAHCRHGNREYYLGSDRKFYRLDDADSTNVGQAIEKAFESLTDAQLQAAVVWSFGNRVYVSAPTGVSDSVCYALDTVSEPNCWVNLSYPEFRVNYAVGLEPFDGGGEVLHLARTGANGSHRMITAAYDWNISITSHKQRFGNRDIYRILQAHVEGDIDTGNPALALVLQVGDRNRAWQLSNTVSGPLLNVSEVHSKMQGTTLQWSLNGILSSGYISRVAFGCLFVRSKPVRTAPTVLTGRTVP